VVTTNLFYSACGAINGFCDHSLIKANHKTHKITSRTNPISLVKRNIYDNKNIYKILLRTQLFCLIKISALYNNFRGPTQLRTNSYLFFFFFLQVHYFSLVHLGMCYCQTQQVGQGVMQWEWIGLYFGPEVFSSDLIPRQLS